jgi:RNA polymerase sigma-70 factor (ECF subfamily)
MSALDPALAAPERASAAGATASNLLDFRTVFEVEADFVARSLRRLGVRASEVEDATHEVFLALHARFSDFDPARPLRSWLYGFILRVAARERRRTFHRLDLPGNVPDVVDPIALPDQAAEDSQNRKLVLEVLEELPFDQRAVFVMHELDGLPIPEVALAVDVPLNTAYSRLRLARDAFAQGVRQRQRKNGAQS